MKDKSAIAEGGDRTPKSAALSRLAGVVQGISNIRTARLPLLAGATALAIIGIGAYIFLAPHGAATKKVETSELSGRSLARNDGSTPIAVPRKEFASPLDPMPIGSISRGLDPAPKSGDLAASIPSETPKSLRDAVVASDPSAQYELAMRLTEGRGVAKDLAAAAKLFERAAEKGLAPAQYRVAVAYEKGFGVARDVALAKAWYLKAAAAGNARAMHNLGVLAADSSSGKADFSSASDWFAKAAKFGVKDSQFNLGVLFARGLGVERDLGQSWMWLSAAAQQGDSDAAKKRDELEAKLDPAAKAAAQSAFTAFKPAIPTAAANEVPVPDGGWDGQKTASPLPGPAPAVPARNKASSAAL